MIYIFIILTIIIIVAASGKNYSQLFPENFGNASDHLGYFNKGYSLAGGLRATTLDLAFRNSLVIGNSGSGKTSAILTSTIFTLARGNSSMVILDVSAENFKNTSGFLATKKDYNIFCFDLTENTDGFNCLEWCETIDDLEKVAQVLIKNSNVESKSDPFWSTSAEMALSVFMQYIFFYAPSDQRNMVNVVLLLETYISDPTVIDRLFIQTDEKLLRAYKTFNATPEKMRLSILSVALTAIKLFKSPSVARATAINTFSIRDFREHKSILYISIPLNQITFLAPLTAVMFEMLFQEALSKIPEPRQKNLFFLIDEMMVMKLGLAHVFPQCRKYRVGCMGLVQDEKMIEMRFSQAESFAIKSNAASKIYMPGMSLPAAKDLQEIIGKRRIATDDGRTERYEYVIDASQLRICEEAIILISSALPLRERLRPFYTHWLYNNRTQIHPYETMKKIPFTEPSLLKL